MLKASPQNSEWLTRKKLKLREEERRELRGPYTTIAMGWDQALHSRTLAHAF
jgi:hypothetical protein